MAIVRGGRTRRQKRRERRERLSGPRRQGCRAMTMLVSLEAAKAHLRVDHDEDDNDIALKLQAASAAVLRYLKTEGIADFVDSSGTLPEDSSGIVEAVPADVRAAKIGRAHV